MIVQLILATGSNAGLAARIQPGYYMIGRHRECQIRPKTRSVSRRHCVVYHHDNTFQVLDLASTSGTKVNDERIEPRQWYPLADGDSLRCGKTVFSVSVRVETALVVDSNTTDRVQQYNQSQVTQKTSSPQRSSVVKKANEVSELRVASSLPTREPKQASQKRAVAASAQTAATTPAHQAVNSGASQPPSSGALAIGDAWQEFDVADFLSSADSVDREHRYAAIRESNAKRRSKEEAEDSAFDEDDDLFEDTPLESDDGTLREGNGSSGIHEKLPASSSRSDSKLASQQSRPNHRPPAARTPSSGRSFSINISSDRLKSIGLTLMLLAALGVLGYSVYSFVNGSKQDVVRGID